MIAQELQHSIQHQEMGVRDTSVMGKMPDRSCTLFDGWGQSSLGAKAAGEWGFSTAHKSEALTTAAIHESACVGI